MMLGHTDSQGIGLRDGRDGMPGFASAWASASPSLAALLASDGAGAVQAGSGLNVL
jgi:hypothetical protein